MGLPYLVYLAFIERAVTDYGGVLQSAGADVPVPSCPGWTLEELTVHLGRVHRWAAAHIRGESGVEQAPGPDGEDLGAWFRAGADELLDALRSTSPDDPCWTLYPPRVAGTWARRQALETSLHCWDAQRAAGIEGTVDGELAADGVAEVVQDMFPRQLRLGRQEPLAVTIEVRLAGPAGGPGGSLLLGAAQSGGSDDPVAVVQGDAEELLLLLWGRRALDQSRVTWSGSEAGLRTVLSAAIVP